MALSFGYSPWFLGLALLLSGGLTFWSYRTTVPSLSPARRWLLGGLRFGSLALICFLLLEPVARSLQETERPPVLAVLVDNSRSMRVAGAQGPDTTAQAVRDRLRSLLEPLEDDLPGTVRIFGFDASLRGPSEAPLDSLSFDGSRSDVATALQAVPDQLQGENLRAIALVSDGQYNSGRNPVRVADRSSLPIHTITVGDTTRRRDLLVRQVVTNDLSYVDTVVPVRVRLGAIDVGNETTTLSLLDDGTVLDTAVARLPEGIAERRAQLSFRPESAGLKQLTVRASPVSGEATTQNNVRTVSLRVLESKRRALVLGAAPSPSYTALRRVLDRDANTTVTARVPRMDGTFYGGALPDSLSSFDVIVCAGFPSSVVPPPAVRRVAQAVDDGTPALFVLDRQTDLSAWREHFASALPVTLPGSELRFTEASVTPVPAERSHPVFQIEDADVSLFRRLPPLSVPSRIWAPTPAARVLARTSRPTLSRRQPVLVVRSRTGRRTAALLATDTWRWATLSADLSAADPLWPGLVTNLLRWLTTQSDDRRVRVRPVRSSFEGDEPVAFTGQVYDESMTPVSQATVSVVLTDSAGTDYPHTMEPLGNGQYELNVGVLPQGRYRYEATAERNGDTLGRDRGQFSVGPLRLEYQHTRANAALMRRIAARSGGTAYTADDADALASDLGASSSFTPTTTTETSEAELWHTSVFLAVILLLLGAEWALRKRFGLT